MFIGIDASRANNEQKTGVEWYAFKLIEELKKIIPENIRVILYSDRPLVGSLSIMPKNWSNKVLKWPPKKLWTQIRMSYEMLVKPPDILFIPAHVFPLIHPKKTVMTVHDVAAADFPESYNWFERWYTKWSAKYAVGKLWKVIAPSNFTKLEILKFKKKNKTDSIFVVHNGYDKDIYNNQKNLEETKIMLFKYNIDFNYILSVGRLEKKKNTARIIKAFNLIKEDNQILNREKLQLVLVGKKGFGFEEAQREIKKSKYEQDIKQLGWLNENDVVKLMQGAEVFVFPSLYEGFGMPVIEAMACGTPVVASLGGSLQEVGDDACIYVNAQNEKEIHLGCKKVLLDKKMREDKINAGLKRVENFSWQKCAKETKAVLLS